MGETQCLAGETLETRAQREVLALNLLHRQFLYRVLRGQEVPSVDTRLVRVRTCDTNGGQRP